MDNNLAKKAVRQVRQIPGEVLKEVKKTPGELADRALEQLGVGTGLGQKQTTVPGQTMAPEKTGLEQMKTEDKKKSEQMTSQIKKELDAEIGKWRQIREEQQRRRREQPGMTEEEKKAAEERETPLVEPAARIKRGILGGPGRVKTAQEKAQAERVAHRPSG